MECERKMRTKKKRSTVSLETIKGKKDYFFTLFFILIVLHCYLFMRSRREQKRVKRKKKNKYENGKGK